MLVSLEKLYNLKIEIGEKYSDYENVAFRVVRDDYDEYDYAIGDSLPASHVWDDGDCTSETLDGTCGIGLRKLERSFSDSCCGYSGDRVFVIAGDDSDYGQDFGELVVKNAKIIDIIQL